MRKGLKDHKGSYSKSMPFGSTKSVDELTITTNDHYCCAANRANILIKTKSDGVKRAKKRAGSIYMEIPTPSSPYSRQSSLCNQNGP